MLTTIASLNLVIEEFRHFSPEVTSILTTEAFGNTVSQWGSRSNPLNSVSRLQTEPPA
ncbi:MAG: hypothetical protein ACUVSE_13785 [Armatimonadota bacterium]